MSSTTNEEADAVCASCGRSECDDTKLKICTACRLVRYCSVACQKDHRPQHKKACKKRVAELRDEILFQQPERSYLGDCPLCFLPLSIDLSKSVMMGCCSKIICNGCCYANEMRQLEENLEPKCPFCRHPKPKSKEEFNQENMKRIKANDPAALRKMGTKHYDEGDYAGAYKYWTKAAGLGDVNAHYQLAGLFYEGEGVEKNMTKFVHHSEEAAIGGVPVARHNLGVHDARNGKVERAVKHFIIAATLGDGESLKLLREGCAQGIVKKEDFEAALRAHQAAVDATKSAQREAAEAAKMRRRSS